MTIWACYARVSGIEQASNNSIPTQIVACRQHAHDRGATEVLEFIDAGVPGDLDWTDRPALNALLDMVDQGALSGVVVYDPDRLARDLGVQLAVTDLITRRRIPLEFCTQQFDASPEGMLFYQLRGAISQFERAKIRERTNRGRKKVLREGRPANKPMPYGLTYDRDQNAWHVVEQQAEIVRSIFRWTCEGAGPTAIARRLNAQNVPPPRGQRSTQWWANTVQRILANSAYAGRLYLHRYNQEGQRKNRFLAKDRRVKTTQRPREEWIEVKVPAIIDQTQWEAVKAVLSANRHRHSGRKSLHRVFLASRLIRCGLCGSAMTGATVARRQCRSYYYRCGGRYGEKRLPCAMPHLRADQLDAALWAEVRTWLTAPDRYSCAVAGAIKTRQAAPVTSAAIARRLAEVKKDLRQLRDLIDKGALREQEVRQALTNLQRQEESLALQQAKADALLPDAEATRLLAAVDRFTAEERYECIREIIDEIVADPSGQLILTPRKLSPGAGTSP